MARAGGEKRGNSKNRRARKLWMLAKWGDGETCPCVHCGKSLSFKTVESDRIIPGGSYARWNVQPSCRRCNLARLDNPKWAYSVRFDEAEYGPDPDLVEEIAS